jgi:hypothetical protein
MVGGAILRPGLRFRAKESQPDVSDYSGSFGIEQNMRLAGRHSVIVPVARFLQVAARFGIRIELALAATAYLANTHRRTCPHASAFMRFCQSIKKAGCMQAAARKPEQRNSKQQDNQPEIAMAAAPSQNLARMQPDFNGEAHSWKRQFLLEVIIRSNPKSKHNADKS